MEAIKYHTFWKVEEDINREFEKIEGEHGTRIIVSNIRKNIHENKPEFDFVTDEYDIRIPDDTSSESEKYRKTKRQNHVPECDYSLRVRHILFDSCTYVLYLIY